MCCDDPPHEKNWRLYHLLDQANPVSSKQIRWNFRKVTLRHHYYKAYLVLYNKSRKALYDGGGEHAYDFIASGAWGPFVPVLGSAMSIIVYCIIMLVEISLLILFFAFLACRVDETITWGWRNVVIPLMIFAIIMLLVAIASVIMNFAAPHTWKEGMHWVDRISPIGNLCAVICYFCLPFVIGDAIKDDTHEKVGDYLRYMCMPIMGDIFYYLTSLIWRWPSRLRQNMTVDNNRPSPFLYYGIFFMGFLQMFCGISQWVVLGYKLDERVDFTWYVAFIPFAVRGGLRVIEAFLRSMSRYTIGIRSPLGVVFDTLGSFLHNGMLIISLYFVAVRIHRTKREVKMDHALIPVYITLAYIWVCLLITMIYMLWANSHAKRVERRTNYQWTPPPEKIEGPPEGASSSNDILPIENQPAIEAGSHAWDQLEYESVSSAAFPEEIYHDDHDYEEFHTDDDDEMRPRALMAGSPSLPYGSPRDNEDDASIYTDDRDRDHYVGPMRGPGTDDYSGSYYYEEFEEDEEFEDEESDFYTDEDDGHPARHDDDDHYPSEREPRHAAAAPVDPSPHSQEVSYASSHLDDDDEYSYYTDEYTYEEEDASARPPVGEESYYDDDGSIVTSSYETNDSYSRH